MSNKIEVFAKPRNKLRSEAICQFKKIRSKTFNYNGKLRYCI